MTPGLNPRKDTSYIAVHCSASVPDPSTDVKVIDRWHRQRGFLMIGYHYVIKTDGTVQPARDEDSIGAHVEGYNATSIGICMVGGVDANGPTGKPVNNFSKQQFDSLKTLLTDLKKKYPKAVIQGHRDFPKVAKACPCFDTKSWLKSQGI
jgi:N-acetylmuramoyl-L-alanine amidase